MDTCSNCGAAVRPGAKFCTACGTRLNDSTASGSGSSGWGEPSPAEPAQATAGPSTSEESSSHEDEVTTEDDSSPTHWTWGASPTTDEPSGSSPETRTDTMESREPDTSATSLSTTDAQVDAGAFQWSWSSPSGTEPEEQQTSDQPSTDETLTSRPDVSTGLEEARQTREEDEQAADAEGTTASTQTAQELGTSAPDDWQQSSAYGSASPTGPYEETDFSSEPGKVLTSPGDADRGDPGSAAVQARALALLDELRSLVPALDLAPPRADTAAASAPPGGSADVHGLLTDLESARSGVISSSDLRSVLKSARSRPRDMDVILDLVSRADSLIALLDDRDRLAAAIDRAVSGLRS